MTLRPGKYIEYDFPLHEVNRLAVKESPVGGRKPIYNMHKWWARRLSCVFRTILLATRIDWEDWDRLEPWKRNAAGDFVDAEGNALTDEREYHRRVRDPNGHARLARRLPTPGGGQTKAPIHPRTAWERLYYRFDDEANAVIQWSFTKPKGEQSDSETLAAHLGSLGVGFETPNWWERIDWEAREPVTILDPFMGGGTTIVESLRLGANAVGVDLNPVAWFVVKKETDGCDLEELERAFRQVEAEVAEEIKRYYRTTCPCCGEQADVMYVFWVKLAPCYEQTCRRQREGIPVPLYNSFVIAKRDGGKGQQADVPRSKAGVAGMPLVAGPERGIRFLKCPNERCGEVYASKEMPSSESTCPACGTTFDAETGYAGAGKYTCPDCGHEEDTLRAAKDNTPTGMDRNVPLPHRMYGVELYCPHCEFKGYKDPDDDDRALFERAKRDFEVRRDTLGYPPQGIPNDGAKTKVDCDMEGHGFHYWHEMFSERQLLCLCRLRDAILRVGDQNIREYLLLAFTSSLECHNMMTRYNSAARQVESLFSSHAFVPKMTTVEGNVWGADYGRGTFDAAKRRVAASVQWATAFTDNHFATPEACCGIVVGDGAYDGPGSARLQARSSEHLRGCLAESEAGAVVTDPPYYGNVMYAELSDFFYVWLRTALRPDHPDQFSAPLTPKDEEIVEQVTRGHGAPFLHKDQAFFTEGLTRVFAESGRRTQDGSLLVFTFHHQANEAWASVLQTALDAGFCMTAVYPVHAEMLGSLHIQDKRNISYDAVIVCRKQTEKPTSVDWSDLSDAIYMRAEQLVRELEERSNGASLAPEDIYVIAIGKCMEQYSRHYWRGQSYVTKGGQPVSIEAALDGNESRSIRGIGEIVDQLVEESEGRMWSAGLDPVSRFYVVNFLGQTEVPWDRLHRRLRHNAHLSLPDLEKRQLVKTAKGKVKVLSEKEREEYLAQLVDGVSPQLSLLPDDGAAPGLTYIDKVHYLVALDLQSVPTGRLLTSWARDAAFVELLQAIARYLDPSARNYKHYRNLADQVGSQGQAALGLQFRDSLLDEDV